MTRLYQLHPMTDEPALPDKTWLSEKRGSLVFPCEHWRRDVVERIVLRSTGQDVALSFVMGGPGSLIRDDLRQALNREMSRSNLRRTRHVVDERLPPIVNTPAWVLKTSERSALGWAGRRASKARRRDAL